MLKYFAKRVLLTLPIFLALIALTFFAIRLVPGDPIEVRRGERGISPERLAELRHEMGLDQPLLKQFWDYLWQVLHGDFGVSLVTHEPVLREFMTLFPATIELAVCAMIFAVVLGIPAGIIAGLKRGSSADYVVTAAAVTGNSMPIFWWGLVLILVVSNQLDLTPVGGRVNLELFDIEPVTGFMLIDSYLSGQDGAFQSALAHLILPAIVLGTLPLAVITRITRSAMLEVLNEDYVRTARAKGLSPIRVVGLHALRNALIPVVTVIGLQVSALIAGAVQTETVFSWPGVGKWLIDSLSRRDYPVLQGGVLLISVVVVFVNLTIDLLYGLINPRIRHGR
ncbi:ABC transporter permease subunit [Labrys wisconsinensis]|uniref:Dipeptide transport system permease protein n=1 Tax=Labrys wisconsinensis TaxID=425677 RepID=A0ABU0IZD0_9HYPH|nr:ABC transporter permease subunit [Labrys wisconsinensis]MDQ0467377.1 dipeptide transport system permease protein [Labrys wisconsinensis]